MAELIPVEYRIRAARQSLVSRWVAVAVLAAMVAGAGVVWAYAWRARQAGALADLQKQYQGKATLIARAREIQAQRVNLAARMSQLQSLENDNVLLSLLKDVSDGFSDNDCLEFVEIDAHNTQPVAKSEEKGYSLRIRGITANDTTHSRLLERLTTIGKKSEPPIDVPLGEKQLKPIMDGDVTVFDLTCKQPASKGT